MYAVFENDGLYEMFDDHDEAKECAARLREFHREEGRMPNANFHKMTKAEEAEWCQHMAKRTTKKTAKKKATKKTPLLNAAEKTTLREARKILKRLTRKWEKLEDEAYENGDCVMEAENKFLAELDRFHIDFDGCSAVIDLEN